MTYRDMDRKDATAEHRSRVVFHPAPLSGRDAAWGVVGALAAAFLVPLVLPVYDGETAYRAAVGGYTAMAMSLWPRCFRRTWS